MEKRQVSQLIDDIDAFTPTESSPFYFLQALAVAKDIENNRVNVVDGQQRITTLKLILGEDSTKLQIGYAREANKALDMHFKNMAKDVIEEKLGRIGSERRTEFCKRLKSVANFSTMRLIRLKNCPLSMILIVVKFQQRIQNW